MNTENAVNKPAKPMPYDVYTVHVICWDGIEYTREATKDEIDRQRKNGHVKEDGYSGITFDFRSSHFEEKLKEEMIGFTPSDTPQYRGIQIRTKNFVQRNQIIIYDDAAFNL